MRRRTAIVTGIAAGVSAVGMLAVPALAQGRPFAAAPTGSGTATCPMGDGTGTPGSGYSMRGGAAGGVGAGMGYGRGAGSAAGASGRGMGMGGQGLNAAALPATGTMTSTQKATLANLAEEEKLAHDLYVALAAKYPSVVQFARIANAETMHVTALRTLMTRYGVTDPTSGQAVGHFTSASVQSLYDSLLTGATTSDQARLAGVAVEKKDIADLTTALSGLTAPDAVTVYTHLRTASQRHQAAFGG